ncbi:MULTISPECIES: sensor histidine kinase [Carnobacterium]|nr:MULTISPECIES: GHKL domain-containing protein [Carnobacterium]MDT1939342.1 GHKL domain-containing protein [Carnobacterium divergens]MDT1941780.1 GHKL domain-containing protein [Carnobacterium divergens]MDT1947578.1 GHKL domain-containing protein [Carnobacterium divergens]MDT1962977.1 GHKL domain-containing protein [Carnobacterium divergens]MDV8934171.1 GHKL domain-containing protein [Carnobacterium sp.]
MELLIYGSLENISLFFLAYQFLEKKISLKFTALIYVLCNLVEFGLLYNINESLLLPFSILTITSLVYFTNRELINTAIIVLLTFIITYASQYLTGFIMMPIYKDTANYESFSSNMSISLFLLTYYLITYCLFLIVKKTLKSTQKLWSLVSNRTFIVIAVVFLTLTIIFFITSTTLEKLYQFDHDIIQITNLMFLAFGSIILIAFIFLYIALTRETEVQKRKLELDQLRIYSNKLEENYQEYRKFRHDYLNMYTGMVGYIETKDMAGLERYFTEHIVTISQSITTNLIKLADLYRIEIPELKGLVATKLLLAQEKGMDISCEVPTPVTRINMDILDLCTAIGILLDNAIEATESIENGKIRLSFITYEDRVLITIENQIEDLLVPIYQLFEHGFSTKGSDRGLGLWYLSEMMDKSDVIHLDTSIENHYFIQQLNIMEESTYD